MTTVLSNLGAPYGALFLRNRRISTDVLGHNSRQGLSEGRFCKCKTIKDKRLATQWLRGANSWSGRGESNPRNQLGRLELYH